MTPALEGELLPSRGLPPRIVVIVDDNPAMEHLTRSLLELCGYEVESYADPVQFLHRASREAPTCVVLELSMSRMSGLEVQEVLKQRGVRLPVVFTSSSADVTSSVLAMRSGALDVLVKPFDRKDLLGAVDVAMKVAEREHMALAEQRRARERLARLSPREREICDRLMLAQPNKHIAADLGVSESTVKVHRSHMMEKLGVTSLVAFVRLVDQADLNGASTQGTRQVSSPGRGRRGDLEAVPLGLRTRARLVCA